MKHIYIFGSVVRGEIDQYSDIDLLLITDDLIKNIDTNKYSVYTPNRIHELFEEGNPFAWHLYYESKLVYSSDDVDFLSKLGKPSEYSNCKSDLLKFKTLFDDSKASIKENDFSIVFDLAMIFLAIRNFATCYTLGCYETPIFSRLTFEKLTDFPLKLDYEIKDMLMMSRISSTRGIDYTFEDKSLTLLKSNLNKIENWFNEILVNYESRV
ncbi:Nucleotidyltransferase domain protein [Flavobacterium columnare]|uniref:Nucleotidyltransferase domain-containing protein n=2 Tax=Flavobacterium TaxID=237 RepID=A0ABW8PTF7_9FLAO|nr:nucleotidyltransferase domain-containing protein [Flavobacterium columnare]SPE78304.1 Nucleotidyltransferase domain protein [Flavobacterium columnare]